MYEGDIKTNPGPQEFYRAGTAPPGFKIPGSATGMRDFNRTLSIKHSWVKELILVKCLHMLMKQRQLKTFFLTVFLLTVLLSF